VDKTIHSEEYATVLALLHQLRVNASIRQVALAQQLGEPQSFVSKYETGERRLDIIELRTICEALGTDLASFVARLEERLNPERTRLP
jgi:transcriptional regulator with XRE-family HTH domain